MDRGLQLSKGTVVVSKRLVTPKPSMWVLAACPSRITKLGQNHDAPRHCAPLPRIGQPLMLAWPDFSVRNASRKSCSSSAVSGFELH